MSESGGSARVEGAEADRRNLISDFERPNATRRENIAGVKHAIVLLAIAVATAPAAAQNRSVEQYVRDHQGAIVREFLDLV
jgi:hypothetical protein